MSQGLTVNTSEFLHIVNYLAFSSSYLTFERENGKLKIRSSGVDITKKVMEKEIICSIIITKELPGNHHIISLDLSVGNGIFKNKKFGITDQDQILNVIYEVDGKQCCIPVKLSDDEYRKLKDSPSAIKILKKGKAPRELTSWDFMVD